jgi:protein-tyrosine-phosphatase
MKKRVLFVCIGNAFRSQMAEAFARAYGGDAVEADSAGLAPVVEVPEITKKVMREKGIELEGHFPKALLHMDVKGYDLVVNMTGVPLKLAVPEVIEWQVPDPVGGGEKAARETRDLIEQLVAGLLIRLKKQSH